MYVADLRKALVRTDSSILVVRTLKVLLDSSRLRIKNPEESTDGWLRSFVDFVVAVYPEYLLTVMSDTFQL